MTRGGLVLGLAFVGAIGLIAVRRARQPEPAPPAEPMVATALAVGPGGQAWLGDESGRIGPHRGPYRISHQGAVRALWVQPDGGTLSLAADSVAWFDAQGRPLQRWRLPDRRLNAALRLADGVLVGTERGDVARLEGDGVAWRARAAHGKATFALAASPDGGRAASVGADGRVVVWRVADGAQVQAWPAHTGWASAVAWPEPEALITAGSDGALVWWSAQGAERRRVATGHGGPITALALDAQRVVTASADGTARVFGRDGTPGAVVDGGSPVVAMLLRGPRLVTSHRDGRVRRWDVVSGLPGG